MENCRANEGYHEPIGEHSDKTRDLHRAILAHNRDEKKEHAAMVLELIRRQDPVMDKEFKDYLFTDRPVAHN